MLTSTFLELPFEILESIMYDLTPNSILELSLSCRAMKANCSQMLDCHHAIRQHIKNFTVIEELRLMKCSADWGYVYQPTNKDSTEFILDMISNYALNLTLLTDLKVIQGHYLYLEGVVRDYDRKAKHDVSWLFIQLLLIQRTELVDCELLRPSISYLFIEAARVGQYAVVKFWMQFHSMNIDFDRNLAISAISVAASNGHEEIVKLLLGQDGVHPAAHDNHAIRTASQNGHLEVVQLLLADTRIDPCAQDNYAFGAAAKHGHDRVVKLLLADTRVDPCAQDNYAIRTASQNRRLEVVKLLLADTRVDPCAQDNYAFGAAAKYGHDRVVKLLLADGRVNPAGKANHAIRAAAKYGHIEVVKLLIADDRVNPAANDNFAIRCAAKRGYKEMIKLLLDDGRGDQDILDFCAKRLDRFEKRLADKKRRREQVKWLRAAYKAGYLP